MYDLWLNLTERARNDLSMLCPFRFDDGSFWIPGIDPARIERKTFQEHRALLDQRAQWPITSDVPRNIVHGV
jgi:hypothetical protein